MYRRCLPLLRMASTKAGMNKILKYRTPIVDYIRQAVNSGTFYDLEALIAERQRTRERLEAAGLGGGKDYGTDSDDDDDGDDDDDDDERRKVGGGGGGDDDDEKDEDGEGRRKFEEWGNVDDEDGVADIVDIFGEEAKDDPDWVDTDDDEDDDGGERRARRKEEMKRLEDQTFVDEEIGLKSVMHGSSILKYPVEYEILSLCPPTPLQPHTPKRFRQRAVEHPTQRLLKKYFEAKDRQAEAADAMNADGDLPSWEVPRTIDDYYYRILHMPPPTPVLQHKSATMVKAYAVVTKQYELIKTEGLSEKTALDRVEELLAEAHAEEQLQSRAVRQHVHTWRRQQQQQQEKSSKQSSSGDVAKENPNLAKSAGASAATTTTSTTTPPILSNTATEEEKELELEQWKESAPTILWNRPHVLFGMAMWGRRLQAVPYQKWTIGATTSLDHWLARNVLQLSEPSWQELLEGQVHMTSRGRDLMAVRHTLFPETLLASQRKRQELETLSSEDGGLDDDDDGTEDAADAADAAGSIKDQKEDEDIRSIEELLATLGGSDFAKEYQKQHPPPQSQSQTSTPTYDDDDNDDDGVLTDAKVTKLVDELQHWRAKNMEQPYDDWKKDQRTSFDMWLDRYLKLLAPGEKVDRTATRVALLSAPPTTQAKSNTFWEQLRDETDAQILLDRMLKDGPPQFPSSSSTSSSSSSSISGGDGDAATTTTSDYPPQISSIFWELPYEVQLQKLLDLGAMRPILDEYASEADRLAFWEKYTSLLLEDVKLEHLVPDPNGPIAASSLDDATIGEYGIASHERFRIEKIAFGSSREGGGDASSKFVVDTPAHKRARDLYKAWNWHKASRARYEERLFQLGRLGLRYEDEVDDGSNKKKKKKNKGDGNRKRGT